MAYRMIVAAAAAAFLSTAALADEITTSFSNAEGKDLGSATLTDTPNGVLVVLDMSGLKAGEFGFHIHEKGTCDPADKFESAGGHLAGGKEHGFKNEAGAHAGDMPNVFVEEDGILKLHMINDRVALSAAASSGRTALLDADGSSLMLHAMADDYSSQPSGHAGERVACASITTGG